MRIAISAIPLAFSGVILSACAAAPSPSPSRVVYLPGDLGVRLHDSWHYAPAIRSGNLVIISGIPAARGETDEAKVRAMFARAREALSAAGATFDDVIEIQTFHTATTSEDFRHAFEAFQKVHAETFHSPYPAWTATGNALLLAPGAIVEMRMVAVVGSGAHARTERVAGQL